MRRIAIVTVAALWAVAAVSTLGALEPNDSLYSCETTDGTVIVEATDITVVESGLHAGWVCDQAGFGKPDAPSEVEIGSAVSVVRAVPAPPVSQPSVLFADGKWAAE